MVHIKAFKGQEIRRFEINPGTTFGELKELVCKLFGLGEDVNVAINYRDRDGDLIMLSIDEELQTALRHLGEEETWHLQVIVQHKQQQQPQYDTAPRVAATSWWDWDPFHLHGGHHPSHHHPSHHHMVHHVPQRRGLFDSFFGGSLWDDDPFGFGQFDLLRQQHQRLQNEQHKKAEMARRHAMRQASVDAKRAADEVQAQASSGEVAEKKPKVVYRHFGSWEPKVEKGGNYVVTTYGPVGYEVHYTHNEQEEEGTKTEDDQEMKPDDQEMKSDDKPETKQEEEPTKME